MARRATVVASLTGPIDAEALRAVDERADILEVRADLAGECDPDRLRDHFDGELLYTLRSEAEGGRGPSEPGERSHHLLDAVRDHDLVDIEASRDPSPEVLAAIPPARRVVSWHGAATELGELRSRLEEMSRIEARWYKLVPQATEAAESSAALALLASARREDLIAFSSGEVAAWTRLLAPRLGAPVVFAAIGEPGAAGQFDLLRLHEDFRLPELPPLRKLCGIVGRDVGGSLSPRLHNALYRELGVEALYVPFEAPSFGDFWLDLVESGSFGYLGTPLIGLSVTAPYKGAAVAVAGALSPVSDFLGVANTLVLQDEVWEAETSDPEGVLRPLDHLDLSPRGRTAAVVGAGGAGLSVAWGLRQAGASVTIANRSEERGRDAARLLGVSFQPLADLSPERFDLLVNATPLGRAADDPHPFRVERLRPDAVVVDLVYRRDGSTPLIREAGERGNRVIEGREVLAAQAERQFERMTGRRFDRRLARSVVGLEETPS